MVAAGRGALCSPTPHHASGFLDRTAESPPSLAQYTSTVIAPSAQPMTPGAGRRAAARAGRALGRGPASSCSSTLGPGGRHRQMTEGSGHVCSVLREPTPAPTPHPRDPPSPFINSGASTERELLGTVLDDKGMPGHPACHSWTVSVHYVQTRSGFICSLLINSGIGSSFCSFSPHFLGKLYFQVPSCWKSQQQLGYR